MRGKVADVPFTTIPFMITQVCRPPGGRSDGGRHRHVDRPFDRIPSLRRSSRGAGARAGWNKFTLPTAVAAADLATYFGDAQIVWKGTSAFSPNTAVARLIAMTPAWPLSCLARATRSG